MHAEKHLLFKLGIFLGIGLFFYFVFCLPSPLFSDPYCQILNDNKGELLGAKISEDGQWRFPLIDSVPEKFEKCIVAFEDRRFYIHSGVDPFAIAGAFYTNLKTGHVVRGGSTLTMQLIRISRKGKKRTYLNKLHEAVIATRMELTHDKSEILRLYASHAPFGGNVVGLEAASWRYFGKRPELLSWAETATMAVLPNAPSLIHLGKKRNLLKLKRDRLLYQLYQNDIIDKVTYELSLEEEIPPKPLPLPGLAPHLLETVSKFKNRASRLNSTIDIEMQQLTSEVVNMHHQVNAQEQIHNMSVLVLDTQSGACLAYVGNTESNGNENKVDMVMAKRSSGSLLKPLLFAAKIDEAQLCPQQLVFDIPIYIDGFSPQNFDKNYRGAVRADDALAMSLNISAVLGLQEYGVGRFMNVLKRMGITTINKGEGYYGLSLILGGAEVSLWEMCGAYASMARTLTTFTSQQSKYDAYDLHGPKLSTNESAKSKLTFDSQVFSAAAIYHTFQALNKLQRPNEEGLWQVFSSSSEIAWKTGTSFGHKDAWAIGVTPKYTIGVWVGNSDGEGRPGLTGTSKAAPVLFDILNRLPTSQWFRQPLDDMEPIAICKMSGYPASSICDHIDTIYVAGTHGLRQQCPYHSYVFTDSEQEFRVLKECCDCEPIRHVWFELPPIPAYYYRFHHADYQQAPPYSKSCELVVSELSGSSHLDMIYPPQNARVFVPKNLENKLENLVFQAESSNVNTEIHWHLDNHYLGSTKGFHTIQVRTEKGEHVISVLDNLGHKVVRNFEVVSN